MRKFLLATTMLFAFASGANAAIVSEGITYTLTANDPLTSSTVDFTLHITGINAPTDTEGGRADINAFALSNANLLTGLTGTSTFGTLQAGGLNASGCNTGEANFFCFANSPPLSTTVLPANSTIDIDFTLSVLSGNFVAWANSDPSFKIDWTGTQNNYNLVSLPGTGVCPDCTPTQFQVPGPAVGAGLPALIAGAFSLLGFSAWRRKRSA